MKSTLELKLDLENNNYFHLVMNFAKDLKIIVQVAVVITKILIVFFSEYACMYWLVTKLLYV